MDTSSWSRAPWSTQASLKIKTDEVGVDFDAFIRGLAENKSDEEMARAFGVPVATIAGLREHFVRFGIDSVVGQD
ncbi:MAG: helix-turn-helix domain-containing protein [Desulfotomaculales bacterium]